MMLKRVFHLWLAIIMAVALSVPVVFADNKSNLGSDFPIEVNVSHLPADQTIENRERAIFELKDTQESMTDRYIVKRKNEMPLEFQTSVSEAFMKAKETKDQKYHEILDKNNISLDAVLNEDPVEMPANMRLRKALEDICAEQPSLAIGNGVSIINSECQELQENKQIIILREQVDTETFIQSIQENLAEQIEYIQPDYELELAAEKDESFSLEVVTIRPESDSDDEEPQTELGAVPSAEPSEEPQPTEEAMPTALSESTPVPIPSDSAATENSETLPEETPAPAPTTTPESVIVAVIDTGIDVTHPDLEEHVVDGYNFVNDNTQVYDAELGMEQAHGTHVAGIIAQTAPDTKIMPLKCFENGRAYTSDLIEAIDFAKENGASIVNCSWGSKDNNRALREAMEQSGLFFVCAAGNNRMDVDETPIYPASFGLDNSISVTSLNQDYGFSYYSNYGMSIDIAAIGREVESTFPRGERGVLNGTSMSAGFISGAAALAKAVGETNLKTRIISTGDRLSNLQNKLKDGRALNLDHLITNTQSDEILDCTPADDFDVHGYQPTPEENWELFTNLKNVKVVEQRMEKRCLVLKDDGSLWTINKKGEAPVPIAGINDVIDVMAGYDHTVILKSDGTVWGWGDNSSGQLGNGTTVNSTVPIQAIGINDVKMIDVGSYYTIALKKDGTVWHWGDGYGNAYVHLEAAKVYGVENVAQISSGSRHVAALTTDGKLYLWGANDYGQIGNGRYSNNEDPQKISIQNVSQVIASGNLTIFIKDDGTAWQCGLSFGGESWNAETYILTPQQIPDISDAVDVSVGSTHILAILDTGEVQSYGYNSYGELGNGSRTGGITSADVLNLTSINYVLAGTNYSIAIDQNGELYFWGNNETINFGLTYTGYQEQLKLQSTNVGIKDIAAGEGFSVVLYNDGTLAAWGINDKGQLGNGTFDSSEEPIAIPNFSGAKSIDCGRDFTVVLKEDGTVWEFGYHEFEQASEIPYYHLTPTQVEGLENIIKISAGEDTILALENDGTAWGWGANDKYQLDKGADKIYQPIILAENVTDLDTNGHYTILSKNGILYGCGNSDNDQMLIYYDKVELTELRSLNHRLAEEDMKNFVFQANDLNTMIASENKILIIGDLQASRVSYKIDEPIRGIAANNQSFYAWTDNSTFGWGTNKTHQLSGDKEAVYYEAPLPLNFLPESVTDLAVGYGHTLVTNGEKVWGWGQDYAGQLGSGSNAYFCVPQRVNSWVAISYEVQCDQYNEYVILISGHNIKPGDKMVRVKYDNTAFELIDPCFQLFGTEKAINKNYGGITLTQIRSGEVEFIYSKSIPTGSIYSGFINSIKLRAIKDGKGYIELQT